MFMVQAPAPPAPPAPPTMPDIQVPDIQVPEIIIGGGPHIEALIAALVAASLMVGFIFLGPVGRALGDGIRHLLGGRRRADEADALRDEVAALQHRVAELEERQDFAERLLAQARERGLLSGPPPA